MRFTGYCKMSQSEIKSYLHKELHMQSHDGFLYRNGSIPVMLVAHMDTVHKEKPIKIKDSNNKISSPQGIGGDDRCGIYMIINIIQKYDCHVLFTEDEEIGCVGANKFCKTELCKSLKDKINFIIELDRKGKNDAVFYECDNKDFEEFILSNKHWKKDYGSFTDICEIAPALNCAAVNLSCGYYNAHTLNEYVNIKEMRENIIHVCDLIKKGKDNYYEWIESKWESFNSIRGFKYNSLGFYDKDIYNNYGYLEDELYIVYEENGKIKDDVIYGSTLEEAIGVFLMSHENICFNQIKEVYDVNFTQQYL